MAGSLRRWFSTNWLTVFAGFAAGYLLCFFVSGVSDRPIPNRYKTPYPFGAPRPIWLVPDNCRVPGAQDLHEQNVAMRTIEDLPNPPRDFMAYAALEHLTQPWGPVERVFKDIGMLCPPTRLIERLDVAAKQYGTFQKAHRLEEHDLKLARGLGPRNEHIVRAVAATAFNEHVILDRAEIKDIRPFARLILAEFGSAASPWVARARKEMSAETALGTGAAQIAATSGDPAILAEIERLMLNKLADLPRDQPIARLDRDRLYGLSYAIGMVGSKGAPFSRGVIDLLDRKVVSAAAPFGGLPVEPRRMCWVADRLGGKAAEAARAMDFCASRWALSEQ
jgi:hypothetical protein